MLTLTILIAFIVVLLAIASLAIGWLITGKSKIVRGACGLDPHKYRNQNCGTPNIHCDLCDPQHKLDPSENQLQSKIRKRDDSDNQNP